MPPKGKKKTAKSSAKEAVESKPEVAEPAQEIDASKIGADGGVQDNNAEVITIEDEPVAAVQNEQSEAPVDGSNGKAADVEAADPVAEVQEGEQGEQQVQGEEVPVAAGDDAEPDTAQEDAGNNDTEQNAEVEMEAYEQVEGVEVEEGDDGVGDEGGELPLEPEEFEELPEHEEEEQVYEEEQQVDEYALEYVQEEQEYAHEEQDYNFEVEDAEHAEFEPDFDQLAEHEEDNTQAVTAQTDIVEATQLEGAEEEQNKAEEGDKTGGEGDDKDAAAGEQTETVEQAATSEGQTDSKLDDSKRKRRPISWNDWKGVDEKPKDSTPPSTKTAATNDPAKKPVDEKKPSGDGKSSRKRSRSRSPTKPSSSKDRERSKSRGASRGRSTEREKDKGKSSEHPSSSKKPSTEKTRSDSRRPSPPRRSQLMGPGPVIKGRVVPVRSQATPVVGPDGRVVAVRRPVITRPGVAIRRQSPPPGFVGRGLVPVVPLRAGPLRAGLPPGEILVPQLSRRASFPPGRGPIPVEGRLINPANLPADIRLATPRDVRGMQIVHVPREQLRDIRTLRPVRDAAIPLRGGPAPRGEPMLIKGGPVLRGPAPALQRTSRDAVPEMRGTLKDNRSMGSAGRHEDYRSAVPSDMHGRLQGGRQSPPRNDRPGIRSTSAPIPIRTLDDSGRSRPSAALPSSRRPPSPHRVPSNRHSPPRPVPQSGGSMRRPADPSIRGRSPPPKRSRHDPQAAPPPARILPGPSLGMDGPPRGGPPGSTSRPSASISTRGGPTSNGGRAGPPMHMQASLPPPPGARQGSMPPPRSDPAPRSQPRDDRGRMMHGAPGSGARGRSPPRDDRREMERRENERRDGLRRETERRELERREQEKREQDRRGSAQRNNSTRLGSMGSSRDDRRMTVQPQQQPGPANDRGHGGGGWSARGQPPPMQQQGAVAHRPQGTRQQGHMIQQLGGPPAQQHLPGPPAMQQQQQAVVGGLPQQLGMGGLGMQQPQGVGNGLLPAGLNWNGTQVSLGAGNIGGIGGNAGLFQPLQGGMQQPSHQPQVPNLAGPTQMGVQKMGGSMMGGGMQQQQQQQQQQGGARVDEDASCWFYIDPQNQTQGPCSITQFRKWLSYLEVEAKYAREYQQFRSVMVWKDGSTGKIPLWTLLQQQGG